MGFERVEVGEPVTDNKFREVHPHLVALEVVDELSNHSYPAPDLDPHLGVSNPDAYPPETGRFDVLEEQLSDEFQSQEPEGEDELVNVEAPLVLLNIGDVQCFRVINDILHHSCLT